eukprot:TRINITY_DN27591_c0_g1_i1.p1 TRINITY_DN27591_c0_g1~~TRINITY_DN27591_c0_g1_i1.p1  ORF type:complete len:666 (-),score=29.45 TRINITY_DN27591_c0_g1_i1:110-1915(-)
MQASNEDVLFGYSLPSTTSPILLGAYNSLIDGVSTMRAFLGPLSAGPPPADSDTESSGSKGSMEKLAGGERGQGSGGNEQMAFHGPNKFHVSPIKIPANTMADPISVQSIDQIDDFTTPVGGAFPRETTCSTIQSTPHVRSSNNNNTPTTTSMFPQSLTFSKPNTVAPIKPPNSPPVSAHAFAFTPGFSSSTPQATNPLKGPAPADDQGSRGSSMNDSVTSGPVTPQQNRSTTDSRDSVPFTLANAASRAASPPRFGSPVSAGTKNSSAWGALDRRMTFILKSKGASQNSKLARTLRGATNWTERRAITMLNIWMAGLEQYIEKHTNLPQLNMLHGAFLAKANSIIQAYGGTIEHFTPNTIVAVFNASSKCVSHMKQACLCSLQCRRELNELTFPWSNEYGITIRAKFAISSGKALVGVMGPENAKSFVVGGSLVQFSQVYTRILRSLPCCTVLVDDTIFRQVEMEFSCQGIDFCFIPYLDSQRELYQLISRKEFKVDEWMYQLEEFEKNDPMRFYTAAWKHYREGQYDQALGSLESHQCLHSEDGVAKYLQRRLHVKLDLAPPTGPISQTALTQWGSFCHYPLALRPTTSTVTCIDFMFP